MNLLDLRKYEVMDCLKNRLPLILSKICSLVDRELQSLDLLPIGPQYSTCGFHFTNVLLARAIISGQKFEFKVPVPNEDGLFLVSDTHRILTNELADSLVSVRYVEDNLLIRWQFSMGAFVSDEKGYVYIGDNEVPLWHLVYSTLTDDELQKYGLWFTLSNERTDTSVKAGNFWIQSEVHPELLTPFQKLVLKSIVHSVANESNLPTHLRQLLPKDLSAIDQVVEDSLDPLTVYHFKCSNREELVRYTVDCLSLLPSTECSCTNVRFKRVRSYEVVLIVLMEKLFETIKQAKYQQSLRIDSNWLLKKMFTDRRLQKLFEYYDLANVFRELALKYKLTVMIENVPMDFRSVDMSFKYRIDPLAGPDDESVGKRLFVSLDAEFDKHGRFV